MEADKNDVFIDVKCNEFFNPKKDELDGSAEDIPRDKYPDIITERYNTVPRENNKCPQTKKAEDAPDGYQEFISRICKNKKKLVATPSGKDDWFYNMNHKNRGIAVILNHEIFEIQSLKSRSGTHTDCTNLENVLKNLGFEVKKYIDLVFKQIDQIIEEFSSIDHSDYDCFVMAVLSHGEQGIIYSKDTAYKPELLMDRFRPDKCPTLAGKPKLYFIQACQGDQLDAGIEVRRTHVDSESRCTYRIPLHADFLIAYSTIPGFYSWRNTQKGSWFMQALCEQLEEYGLELDLMTILTFVNRRVAVDFESNVPDNRMMHQQKQIPCITSMLTRIVKFSKKNVQPEQSNHRDNQICKPC